MTYLAVKMFKSCTDTAAPITPNADFQFSCWRRLED